MRRKFMATLLAASMVLSITACGSKAESSTTEVVTDASGNVVEGQNAVKVTAAQAAESVPTLTESYKQYVTLGDYKNMESTIKAEDYVVTDEMVAESVQNYVDSMSDYNEITEGVVADGDTINMDFSGLLDGVAFSNGTATDYTYTVGGNFIEDLDRALVGLEIGKEYDIPCTFPADYQAADLAGKDVIFKVTVNYVREEMIPEYTDDLVKAISATYGFNYTNKADFEAFVRSDLEAQYAEDYKSALYNEFVYNLVQNSTISGQDEAEVNSLIDSVRKNAEAEYEAYGAMTGAESFEAYIKNSGYESMEEFEKDVDNFARAYCNEKMVMYLVCAENNITVTEEELTKYAEDLLVEVNESNAMYAIPETDAAGNAVDSSTLTYENVDALIDAYGPEFYDEVAYEVLAEKYQEFIKNLVNNK
ncbi:MAG: FKBP-type peptidyl-prolyl cis-trans isomerase [Lachnospiraceae bacterium]|nr:FKBP-type peptidyl-prolyl cis-trans isomerase [Lachnospiraceae bacterium]